MSTAPDYPDALAAALRGLRPIAETQEIALADSDGRVLAAPVLADRDLPPFNRAQMDGYAIRFQDLASQALFPVAGSIAAGASPDIDVPPGQCVAIATGAALPRGLDTVIQHELTDRGNPVRINATSDPATGPIARGHAVHHRAADATAGSQLLAPGTILRPHHQGIAASVGLERLTVRRRPRAIVLTSGDEVMPIERRVLPHQIRNSNAVMIAGLLGRIGAEPFGHVHVADERDATIAAVTSALKRADLLVTVGGISVGDRDFFGPAFKAAGVSTVVHGAAIQPGGPIYVGHIGRGQAVVGLPGNPVSALACTCLLIWPLVRSLLGLDPALPWRDVRLGAPVRPHARRRAFRPACLAPDGAAHVPRWAGSGDLVHTGPTDGLLELPIQEDPVAEGAVLRFLPWP